MLFDERRVRAFVAVAERLNFTRAAADLGVAQQPLSQQIARFEADLGVRLFDRTTRSVTLTAAGSALYRDALDLLSRSERAHRNALEASSGAAGHITIGVGNYAIDTILTEMLRAFRARYPNVTVQLYEHHTVDQLDALRSGEIDVGFALLAPDHDDIEREVMHEEGWVVARPGDGGVIVAEPRKLAEFRDAAYVAAPRQFSPGLDDQKTILFRHAGFQPAIAQYAMQTSTMLALVAAGVGLLLTPAATQNLRRDGVEFVRIATPLRVQLHMIARREKASAVLENFRTIARERRAACSWLTGTN